MYETRDLQKTENGLKCYIQEEPKRTDTGNNSWEEWDRVIMQVNYWMRRRYPMGSNGLLSKLGMDITALKDIGEAVTLSYPAALPSLVATDSSKNQYAIKLPESAFDPDTFLIGAKTISGNSGMKISSPSLPRLIITPPPATMSCTLSGICRMATGFAAASSPEINTTGTSNMTRRTVSTGSPHTPNTATGSTITTSRSCSSISTWMGTWRAIRCI